MQQKIRERGSHVMTIEKMMQCLWGIVCCMPQHVIGGFGAFAPGNRSHTDARRRDRAQETSSKKRGSASDDHSVGGQAVIEGVMIRSPHKIATAVRKPDNEILIKSNPYIPLAKRYRLLNIPVVRGALSFFEMMVIGMQALNFSADVALDEMAKAEKGKGWQRTRSEKLQDGLILAGMIALAFGLALGIFFALPLFLTEVMGHISGLSVSGKRSSASSSITAPSTRVSTPTKRERGLP
jgi:hypothetical protein